MKYQVKEVCLVKGRVRGTNETVELTREEADRINSGSRFPLVSPAPVKPQPVAPPLTAPSLPRTKAR